MTFALVTLGGGFILCLGIWWTKLRKWDPMDGLGSVTTRWLQEHTYSKSAQ